MSPRRGEYRWTEENIVAAIHEWAEYHGEPPRAADWARHSGGGRPSVHTVRWVFGTWNAAIRAAGFKGRRGRKPVNP